MKNKYALPRGHLICAKKQNEMATTSTLIVSGLTVWPKDMIVQSHTKNIDNFGFDIKKQNMTCLYLIVPSTRFNEIT